MATMNRCHGHTRAPRISKHAAHLLFLGTGAAATLWFLLRVIPKPSRATYPCMRAAAPVMSGFVLYILGIFGTVLAFKRARTYLLDAKYTAALFLIAAGLCAAFLSFTSDERPVYANSTLRLDPNQPVGEARGIYPGRVVWVWDSSATNQNCTNAFGDGWFLPQNTNANVVTHMVDEAVKQVAGQSNVPASWDALFRYFNQTHGKGNVGCNDSEKIFIRTNQVSASDMTIDPDYTVKNTNRYGMAETSPQVVLAVLRQLIDSCGIREENIAVGDPMKHMYKHLYDMWHGEFPNVTYIDIKGTYGRTKPVASSQPSVFYSDRGTILKDGGTTGNPVFSDYLPTVITEASYLIAIPAMKGHARGGVTLCGKLHFGSNLRGSATHLHGGLVCPNKVTSLPARTGYGLYRVQVDLMGNKDLGGKTVIFLVDALWGGSEANDPPRKFSMSPFNTDWTSSLFVSQDQLALESVCFDFLKAEFTSTNPYGSYPQIEGADDHILQAADSSYWPTGFRYDPENDGSPLGSLGVCEHWNNPTDKQYTRNLGTGNGIELRFYDRHVTSVKQPADEMIASFALMQNYPNPFNPLTIIKYTVGGIRSGPSGRDSRPAFGGTEDQGTGLSGVKLVVYDLLGREVAVLVNERKASGSYEVSFDGSGLASGVYVYRLTAGNFAQSRKMMLVK